MRVTLESAERDIHAVTEWLQENGIGLPCNCCGAVAWIEEVEILENSAAIVRQVRSGLSTRDYCYVTLKSLPPPEIIDYSEEQQP